MPHKVLVVDDSSSSRLILGGILRNLGVEMVEAVDGQDALARLSEHWPLDLVLLDWHMDKLDGPGFLRQVRDDLHFDGLKVVMVSAEAELEKIRQTVPLGIDGYILKPFDRKLVGERLSAILAAG